MLISVLWNPFWSSLASENGVSEISIGVSSNFLAISQQLKQVLDLFSEKVRHVWVGLPVNTSHFCTINLVVHHEVVGNERSLWLVDFLALLLLVELQRLGLVVMSQIGAVENPEVWLCIRFGQVFVQLVFSNNNLEDWNPSATLTLTKEVVALAVNRLPWVRASAVALANKALPHFFVLIYFVATFCKSDSRIAVQNFELVHKAPQSPRPSLLKKISKKVNNFIGAG